MKITFRMEGGLAHFPGLAAPFVIETECLPKDEARELEALVQGTGVWDGTAQAPAPSGSKRDARTYSIELVEGTRTSRVTLTDPVPAEWSPLVRSLQARQRKRP